MEPTKGDYILASIVTLFIGYGVIEDILQGYTSMRGSDYSMNADAPLFWDFVGFRVTILLFVWAHALGRIKN